METTVRRITLMIAGILVPMTGLAQTPAPDPLHVRLLADQIPTTFQVLKQPMSELLNIGFSMVSGAAGSYVLHRVADNKWVACDVREPEFGDPAASRCAALN